ncbi:thiamine phosphate synthase [Alteromonas sp. ASW11-130]|uniref:thiamine phosphate synthase n=1 Tax=Alteromonas sp. ASW11-130 TaxID=3015775 RepID=UPI0022424F1C|nr:thiamine phosphate synthase [Alteromonas sp. ASW11-130]MCW8091119.1 thiamine phosphate synthase [Alteromonas sp. ASW11-130]
MSAHPIMWSIGGLDPSGGAGVTRDCIIADTLGVHTCPIATMVTAQPLVENDNNATQVVSPVAIDVFKQQLVSQQATLPASIKIGALANDEQIDALFPTLVNIKAKNPTLKVVFDPVVRTTSGLQLSFCSRGAILSLLTYVDIITPNVAELSWLAQQDISSRTQATAAAKILINVGIDAVLIKGGHAHWEPSATDWLIAANQKVCFTSPRLKNTTLRGSGCRLASALSAALAKQHILEDAVCLAKSVLASNFIDVAEAQSINNTPVTYHRYLPLVDAPSALSVYRFPRLLKDNIGLYPIVDSVEWVKLLLQTGINVLQLRIKNSSIDISSQIKEAVLLARDTGCQLFINDYWQEAIEAGAYGVHLGQEDVEAADLAAIANAGLRLGISTHGYCELARALQLKPSYIALGHIFATTTKDMPSAPQGLERLTEYVKCCGDIPTVAIGGINKERFLSVAKTAVDGIAVVSAIVKASAPLQATRDLQGMLLQEPENVN